MGTGLVAPACLTTATSLVATWGWEVTCQPRVGWIGVSGGSSFLQVAVV